MESGYDTGAGTWQCQVQTDHGPKFRQYQASRIIALANEDHDGKRKRTN